MLIAPAGFEPTSQAPKARMLLCEINSDHYTTGLSTIIYLLPPI